MTTRLLPMLATPGRIADVDGEAWEHEFKWDGVRALAAVADGRVQLRSRAGNDVTAGYPELHALAEVVPPGTVLDGEVVALGEDGAPSFPLLQHRMHLRDPGRVAVAMRSVPVRLLVFDVLGVGGDWLLERPYTARREALLDLGLQAAAWATPPSTGDVRAALTAAEQAGLEGVVSKRRDSTYRPGERSALWRKMRLVREQEVVVGGLRHGTGGRAGSFGSLLVGTYEDGELRFGGGVGSGFTDRELARLVDVFASLAVDEPPFVDAPREADVTWVRPEVVVRVRYREWTPDGRLRQPSYRGQRPEVDPHDVHREA